MGHRPIWTEGLFISQHHFQAQDHYHEALLRERVSALRRYNWGLSALEIDERLLQAGQFGLRRFAAVWPDGLVVRCGGPQGDPLPEPRSFEPHLRSEEGGALDVFAGITSEGGSNVSSPGAPAGQQRFVRQTRGVEDFNGGGNSQDVEFAQANVRIVFGTERREGLTTVPVAQLVRQSDGRVVVRDTFVPPVVHIAVAPFVTSGLRRVLGAMVARQRELAASRKQRNAASIEFHYTDARRFWLLHTLNGAIPVVTHLVDTDHAHPEEVYLALAKLVGELSTFSADAEPTSIPRFDYARLGEMFEFLFARTLTLLTIDSLPVYTEIALQRRPDGMFVGRIVEPRLVNHEFFVAVRSALAETSVRERIPQILKVADWKHIIEVVKQARHGVRAEVDWNPSSSLPLKPGLCFFRLRREGPFWEEITKSFTLALYLPSDADWKDTAIAVYAIDPMYLR
jgi:type VI secretion system protein ImpJ